MIKIKNATLSLLILTGMLSLSGSHGIHPADQRDVCESRSEPSMIEASGEELPSFEPGIDDHNSNYDVMLPYDSPLALTGFMFAAWCLVLFLLCVTKKVHTSKSPPAPTVSMNRRQSFVEQFHAQHIGAPRRASTYKQRLSLAEAVGSQTDKVTAPFQSNFAPTEMRQLALVAHNHMKPAMKQFIETYSEILKKFRITGTQTTMKMCKSMWGEDDPAINYGLTCTSGPLGGDAQIAALMCMEDLGGMIFFIDPLSAHPHQADIDSLLRLSNCGNIIVCTNPASATSMMHTLRAALTKRDKVSARGMIPSFFETLESPAVEEYKHQQALAALANVIKSNSVSSAPAPHSAAAPREEKRELEEPNETERGVSFDDQMFEKMTLEKGTKKRSVLDISDTVKDRALMGQSMAFSDARLAAILACDSEDDTDDDAGGEVTAAPVAKVSRGLFGIKTKTATKRK